MDAKDILKKAGIGGGSIAVIVTLIIAYTDTKVEAIQTRLDEKDQQVREYVDIRHTSVRQRLDDILKILERIDNRLYELNKGRK